jgi:hypothetical protein
MISILLSLFLEFPRALVSPLIIGSNFHYLYPRAATWNAFLALTLISLALRLAFGSGSDFAEKYPQVEGPYRVGYGTMRTEKHGTELFVWYPVNKGARNMSERIHERPGWIPHGLKTVKGLIHLSFGWPMESRWTPNFIFSGLMKAKMDALRGAPVADDFKKKKLIPIFFSHGLTCHP